MIELKEIKRDYDYKLKLVLFGPSNVGKSCYLSKLIYNEFAIEKADTVGIEIGSKYFETNQKVFKVDLWDANGGLEGLTRFRPYLANAVGGFNRRPDLLRRHRSGLIQQSEFLHQLPRGLRQRHQALFNRQQGRNGPPQSD
jgi:hypothetical protein